MSLKDRMEAKLRAVEEFSRNLDKYILEAVQQNEHIIIDMNAENQLFERGVNRLGVSISDYAPYSPTTIQLKRVLGQPTNRVTLRDTGDFHESFSIEYGNDQFTIFATDLKTRNLMDSYGPQILGLTPDNIAELRDEYVMPYLQMKLREIIVES